MRDEIVSRLTKDFAIKHIILFGSHAWGTPHHDSDVDLVVVLDQPGIETSLWTRVKRNVEVTSKLRDIRMKIPMDVLVYSRDEWDRLVNEGISFYRTISRHGVPLA